MEPKYSCSHSTIERATRIYEENVGGIRKHRSVDYLFPEEYSDFLGDGYGYGSAGMYISSYLYENPGFMELRKSILNIVIYIPGKSLWYNTPWSEEYWGGPSRN